MTPAEKRRLARQARRLAYECVEGTAPELGTGLYFGAPPCATGLCIIRARIRDRDMVAVIASIASDWLVLVANDYAKDQADRRSRLVFPLLDFADELDGGNHGNAAQAAPKSTP